MANKIVGVVRHDALREELHKNAAHEYQGLSWNRVSDRVIELYKAHLSESEVAA
jgi:glycosyltransferase involved in cell wall biosynthesis